MEDYARKNSTTASNDGNGNGTVRQVARIAVITVAVLAALAIARFCPSRGDVFFTGLDDSALCALARGYSLGLPLRYHDEAFASVPAAVRPKIIYRPILSRKTHDLAHEIETDTFIAKPFFQPFCPLQRAFLPGLPVVLALALLAGMALWAAPRRTSGALAAAAGLAVATMLLTPWPAHFCLSPFSEGMATLLAALALSLSFRAPRRSGAAYAAFGAAEGLLLGLSVTFHQTLSVCAMPIAAFAVLRAGRPRHALFLAIGALVGIAPLAWSTKCVAAPYGDFLSLSGLREMIAVSPDIRTIAIGLTALVPLAALLAAASFSPRLRALAARPKAGATAAALGCATAALALVAACVIPGTRAALLHDRDGLVFAIPAIAALCAAAFARRRPSACFIVATLSAAALPFLKVQGNEVHIGLWSLRRSMPFLTLLPLAAYYAAFDTEGASGSIGRWLRRAATALVPICAAIQMLSMPLAYGGGGECGASELIGSIESSMRPDALYLFARIPDSTSIAAAPGHEAFGLNDLASNALEHDKVVDWLRDEAKRRPVYVVALDAIPAPIAENGIVLCPDGDPILGEVRRTTGGSFGTAKVTTTPRTFAFLRVHSADAKEGAAALRGGSALRPGLALPFGMAKGGWDVPRRGKPGRWTCDGAAFWGPVPAPGETVEIAISASWWTRDGQDAPQQTLRLETPYPCSESSVADMTLKPCKDFQPGTWRVTRPADDATILPATALYRIRAAERYDERGFPPALAACFESLSFRLAGEPPPEQ